MAGPRGHAAFLQLELVSKSRQSLSKLLSALREYLAKKGAQITADEAGMLSAFLRRFALRASSLQLSEEEDKKALGVIP